MAAASHIQASLLGIIDAIKDSNRITDSIAASIKTSGGSNSLINRPATDDLHVDVARGLLEISNIAASIKTSGGSNSVINRPATDDLHVDVARGLLEISNIAAILRSTNEIGKNILASSIMVAERINVLKDAILNMKVVGKVVKPSKIFDVSPMNDEEEESKGSKPTMKPAKSRWSGMYVPSILDRDENTKEKKEKKGKSSSAIDFSSLRSIRDTITSGGLLKGLAINITPQFVINSYINGIQKLINGVKKLDVGDADTKIKTVLKLGNALSQLQNLKLIKVWLAVKLLPTITNGIVAGIAPLNEITNDAVMRAQWVGEVLEKIFRPLKSITTSLIKGGVSLALIAGSLALAAYSFKQFGGIDWAAVLAGTAAMGAVTAMAYVIGKMPIVSLIQGIAGLALISGSIALLGYSLKQMQGIEWGTFGKIALAIGEMIAAYALLDVAVEVIAPGIVILAAVSASLIGLAFSLEKLQEVDWATISAAGAGLLSIGAGAMALTVGLPGLLLAPVALYAFAKGMKWLSGALDKDELVLISSFFTKLTELTKNVDGTKLFGVAGGIGSLGLALAAFGVGSAIDGIVAFFGKLVGEENPIDKLINLGKEGSGITAAADGLLRIADGLSKIGAAAAGLDALNKLDTKKLEEVAKFQMAVAAGYTSDKDYADHNYNWRGAVEGYNTKTDILTGDASVSAARGGSGTGVAIINNNYGGNTNVNSSSNNTNNSVIVPPIAGSGIGLLYGQ